MRENGSRKVCLEMLVYEHSTSMFYRTFHNQVTNQQKSNKADDSQFHFSVRVGCTGLSR